ncbi:MAG: hypothetical protein HY690_08610 [Chloroflexi bacterium]|nr:hypothetical protein [Chloroflexota bacterium]
MHRLSEWWRRRTAARDRMEVPRWAEALLARAVPTAAEDGCPVCRAEQAAERAFTALGTQPERAQAEFRARLARSPLCQAHASALLAAGAGLPSAQGLLAARLERLATLQRALAARATPGAARDLAAARWAVAAPEACPACEVVVFAAWEAARWSGHVLGTPGAAEPPRVARALCTRHLPLVLQYASPEAARLVCEAQTARIRALLAELAEFFRKVDYRYAHEPKGEEQSAWLRGIERMARPAGPPARPTTEREAPPAPSADGAVVRAEVRMAGAGRGDDPPGGGGG